MYLWKFCNKPVWAVGDVWPRAPGPSLPGAVIRGWLACACKAPVWPTLPGC